MSSYWSKRRKVVSNVRQRIDALNQSLSMTLSHDAEEEYSNNGQALESGACFIEASIDQGPTLIGDESYDGNLVSDLENIIQIQNTEDNNEEILIGNLSSDQHDSSGNEMSDYSDGTDDSEEDDVDISSLLVAWVGKFNVSHTSLNALLSILRKYHPHLPKDSRTLLKTAKGYEVQNIAGGLYYHFGIESWVKPIIGSLDLRPEDVNEVSIQINIDGLPLYKSSSVQLWPILGRLVKPVSSKPFVIGLFSGNQKPEDVHEYLGKLTTELQYLFRHGISISDLRPDKTVFSLCCIICDAPARAFVKQIKGHSGYHGCDKCVQTGVWNNKVTFPETNSNLRTDLSFHEMHDEEHHLSQSPFHDLPVGMVSQFPVDPMHLVYLGVVKRMIRLWMKGPIVNACRVGHSVIKAISQNLEGLQKFLPREFNRKARTLDHIDRWKATEYRQFLLYTGPVVLKKNMPHALYKHFILFFVSIYCLSSSFYCRNYIAYCQELLIKFVQQFGELYGTDMLVFNVHGLVHLTDDVHKFGPLDNFSAFAFESFLGHLKRLVRRPSLPLQQVIRRISESVGNHFDPTTGVNLSSNENGVLKKKHNNGPLPSNRNIVITSQYQAIQFPSLYLCTNKGDNCVLINDDVAVVKNIVLINGSNEKFIVYQKFINTADFFISPLHSSDLGVKRVLGLSDIFDLGRLSDISCKCVLLPYDDYFVCTPMLHDMEK